MSKKIDSRLSNKVGDQSLPLHAAVKSPWEKLVSYHDAVHYCQRYNAALSAVVMQAFRMLVPDYVERSKVLCKVAYDRLAYVFENYGIAKMKEDELNMHPFMRGNFVGGLIGDSGDEIQLMCGRVNDFGTYRAEKELDVCYWGIVGSEVCRSTTQSLQAAADCTARLHKKGPHLEYHMVEARACGDFHCRIVAESREKYPMPEHEQWECFGPVGSADQIKYTHAKDSVKESMVFREECDYSFSNGTNSEWDSNRLYPQVANSHAFGYILPALDALIREGRLTDEQVDHAIRCTCEAAGKATFIDDFAKEGLRQWMGVPQSISNNDCRLAGGYIEMFLQCMRIPYEIEAFNGEEVIYNIDRTMLGNHLSKQVDVYLWFWYGMTKSLVSAEWSLWEENSAEDKVRLKIAKKIDKFS